MNRFRWNYWNCSKFADLIRGEAKPFVLPFDEWDNWHEKAKQQRTFRYWLAETGLKTLQNTVMFPYDLYHTLKVYIRNRWIDQSHVLQTGLKVGEYYDLDTKILHGLFNELTKYVEVELAHLSRCDKKKTYKFRSGRCIEAGLDHLDWASKLTYGSDFGYKKNHKDYNKPTPQAVDALKIKDLYLWWTKTRPNRPDPLVVSGYHNLSDEAVLSKKESIKRYNKCSRIEAQYDKEDTKKLIELIKIRGSLWT
jgi:hypothetical protein